MITDKGQKGKATFVVVNDNTRKQLSTVGCESSPANCNYVTPVMANLTTNPLENDKSPILGMFQPWTTSAVFELQKKVGGVFITQATISDDTYGEYFPQGHWASKPQYAGFLAYWERIRPAFGDGFYRVRVTEVNPLYPLGVDKISMEYCLKEFTCQAQENTIRLEWYNNGKIGDIANDKDILDFSDINWYQELRVPMSIFGYPKSEYETEEIQYTNGAYETVKDKQTEIYELTLGQLPSYIHDIIKTYALMSGTLSITDYSSNNPAEIIQKDVKKKSGYEPRWAKTNKCAPITLELEPRYNNLETDRC